MIAVDTNILVYAHREDSAFHKAADGVLTELAESERLWAIPWPCLHEVLAVVTHPRIYQPPTPLKDALMQVDCWLECPRLHLIGEVGEYWPMLRKVLQTGRIVGPQIHDARIAAICLQHGVKTLWSTDRDYSRIEGLKIVNPLL
ncbi:MAG: PIN domain-containing protein [Deltaproteobacteria bacterium]|nr:PIN domain-containing protein [Deltaproteobacteria bacterium]